MSWLALLATVALPDGDPIYFGTVYPLGAADPVYVYERRVGELDGLLVSTHITRDLDGEVAVAETATHDDDYGLVRYTLLQDQLGRTGVVSVDDDGVTFALAGAPARTQRLADPVVVGPTLVGFALSHLDELRSGGEVDVRFAVLERRRSYRFALTSVPADPGQVEVRMKATSPLVGMAVHPLTFTFDDQGRIARMEGRVPPKVRVGERWEPLDARVEYRFVAPAYR